MKYYVVNMLSNLKAIKIRNNRVPANVKTQSYDLGFCRKHLHYINEITYNQDFAIFFISIIDLEKVCRSDSINSR